MVKNSGGNLIAAVTVVLIVMALLAMSIPRQRIPQRTNQCATNMKNLALASVQHDFSKTYLPGYIQDFGIYAGNGSDPTDPTNRGIPHHKKLGTWAVAILPWLEGQATYEHWAQDRYP